jgi:hypothetical protein
VKNYFILVRYFLSHRSLQAQVLEEGSIGTIAIIARLFTFFSYCDRPHIRG